ncbi:MAG: hypothetical protein ACTSXT_11125 [Candidatus Helarchaeota archaeon]
MIFNDDNKRIIELAKVMSLKLAESCSPRFIKTNFKKIISDQTTYVYEIEELKNKLWDYEKQIQFIPEIEELKSKVQDQANKIKNLENLISSLNEGKITADLQNLLIENEELKSQFNEIQNENKTLMDKIKNLEQSNYNYRNLIDSLETRISEINNKMYEEMIENQKLRKLLYNERNKVKQLEEEKKELISVKRRLENRLLMGGNLFGLSITTQPLSEISKEENSIQFQAEIKRINLELNKKVERIKTLEFEINELKEKIAHSNTADLTYENEKLKEEIEKKNAIILDFNTFRKKLAVQTKNLQNRITDLQNQLRIKTTELEENKKIINELETAVKTGIKDSTARELIAKLQNENHNLRSEIKSMDSAIRAQDKSSMGLRNQVRSLKIQLNKLYNQSKWQLSQLYRLNDILERAGIDPSQYGIDPTKFTADFKKVVQSDDETISDFSEKEKKIRQLEKYVSELENEINEINFRIMSRDVKINELEGIINDIKKQVASKGIKIKS